MIQRFRIQKYLEQDRNFKESLAKMSFDNFDATNSVGKNYQSFIIRKHIATIFHHRKMKVEVPDRSSPCQFPDQSSSFANCESFVYNKFFKIPSDSLEKIERV